MPPHSLVTMRDLVTAYRTLHLPTLKQPQADAARIRRYFDPLLDLPIEGLTIPAILAWANDIRTHSKTQADCCLRILRCMFNRAIEWQLYPGPNPAAYVKRKRPAPRGRYLEEPEIPRLIAELEKEPVMIRLFFYIMLFCGARPGEVEVMLIRDIRLFPEGGGTWCKPTTKNGTEHRISLPFEIPNLIRRHLAVTPQEQIYLFQNRRKPVPLSYEFWFAEWQHIRRRAQIEDVQLRDLRRTCATQLLNTEHPLDLISLSKGVLNHMSLITTQVYAIPQIDKVGRALDSNMRKALSSRTHKEVSHVQVSARPVSIADVCAGADLRPVAPDGPGDPVRLRQSRQ